MHFKENSYTTQAVGRNDKVYLFISLISENLIYGRFSTYPELISDIYASLVSFLVEKGELRVEPFDKSINS